MMKMASTNFHLQFQEFDDDADRSTAVRMEDEGLSDPPTVRRGAEPEDELHDADDQTQFLNSEPKSAAFWTLEFYQTFFNVDTHQVMDRLMSSVLPWRGKNFLRIHIRNNPDLYGPFWICITLVFAIGVSGNLSSFLVHRGHTRYRYTPDFRKVTMAATVIFSYSWLVPVCLWGFLMWRNRKISSAASYTLLQIICVYGYSLSIYIPAVVLWMIPSEVLRWICMAAAVFLSGSLLVLSFWPLMRDDRPRVRISVLTAVITLHVLLGVGCKVYFFSTYENEISSAQSNKIQSVTATKAH